MRLGRGSTRRKTRGKEDSKPLSHQRGGWEYLEVSEEEGSGYRRDFLPDWT